MTYLFLLGNAPELATAELEAVLGRHEITPTFSSVDPRLLRVSVDKPLTPEVLNILGGTIKVVEVGADFPDLKGVLKAIESFLKTFDKRVVFSLSIHPSLLRAIPPNLEKDLKKKLEADGHKVRFVAPQRPEWNLSSVVVTKQKVVEFVLIPGELSEFTLGQTFWVQEFEEWGKRDYGRPAAEAHLGMLPPKVARMMVNLGFSSKIVDPFCGAGTIVAEALVLGAQAKGIDQDPNQVKRTKDNLEWLCTEFNLPKNYQVIQGDARRATQLLKTTVGSIVTEPFLGPNDSQNKALASQKLHNLMQELIGLYIRCLENWKEMLPVGGKVVMALPSFTQSNYIEEHLVKTIVDKANLMGYSLIQGPFPYFRAQAVVRRNICVFVKN